MQRKLPSRQLPELQKAHTRDIRLDSLQRHLSICVPSLTAVDESAADQVDRQKRVTGLDYADGTQVTNNNQGYTSEWVLAGSA